MRLKTMTEVKYDLDLNSKPCRGVLRYKDGAVYALEDGKEVFSRSLKNIGELVQYTDVGCGSLEISPFAEKSGSVYDGAENITVCRFSMSAAEDIGEFCKAVNHRIKTGEEPERIADSADKCPVCGRRYPIRATYVEGLLKCSGSLFQSSFCQACSSLLQILCRQCSPCFRGSSLTASRPHFPPTDSP